MDRSEIKRLIRAASKDTATVEDKTAAAEAIKSADADKSRGAESRLAGSRA